MKRRIMFMANSLYSGGAERVLQTTLNHLNTDRYDITVYSLHRENIDPSVYKKSFHYKVVFDKKFENVPVLKAIYKIYSRLRGTIFNFCPSWLFYFLFIHGKYDVEIAFIEGESTKIVSGSTNRKSKKIAWVHTDLSQNPWTSFLFKNNADEAKHYKQFDRIICVSEDARTAFCQKYNIFFDNVIVHYNPIDAKFILEQAYKENNSIVFQHDRVQIVAVGRLVEQKGFDRLLQACKELVGAGYKFQLHIIGMGEQYQMLEKYINENDLQSYVFLHGYQSNPYVYMKQCDILICSSHAEGYSLVIAEAMILGLAIVTTSCSGPCELIDNGKYGILVDNSVDGIYQGLKFVLSDPILLEKYKALAAERGSIFDVDENIKQLEKIFDEG